MLLPTVNAVLHERIWPIALVQSPDTSILRLRINLLKEHNEYRRNVANACERGG